MSELEQQEQKEAILSNIKQQLLMGNTHMAMRLLNEAKAQGQLSLREYTLALQAIQEAIQQQRFGETNPQAVALLIRQ